MSKIITKLGMGRLYLMCFILLCCVYTSENAFSVWHRDYMKVKYYQKEKFIILDFIYYESSDLRFHDNFLGDGTFYYYEIGKTTPTKLMSTNTIIQKDEQKPAIFISKNKGVRIELLNCITPAIGPILSDVVNDLKVVVNITNEQRIKHNNTYTAKMSHMKVKWKLPPSCNIRSIKLSGCWVDDDYYNGHSNFVEVYPLDIAKSVTYTMDNILFELNSEIVNDVRVTSGMDAITVTGAEPGENIKIYTASGVEVKSVVANDDFVNIKLPTNQIYIVKAGQTRHKVAL